MRLRIYGLFIARDDHGNTTASCGEKSVDCRWGSDTKSTADVLEETVGGWDSGRVRVKEVVSPILNPEPWSLILERTLKQSTNEKREAPRVAVAPFNSHCF